MLDSDLTEDERLVLKENFIETLNEALESFRDLLNIQYNIVVARKDVEYLINLVFLERNFIHLSGIDKLVDIALVKETPNLYKKLITNNSESDKVKSYLASSNYFDEIVSRLYCLIELRQNFYNAKDNKHYKFLSKKYGNYTSIKFDYLIRSECCSNVYYYFLRHDEKSENPNQFVVVSLFIENKKDYTNGQTYMYLLSKEEINKTTGEKFVIFKKTNNY